MFTYFKCNVQVLISVLVLLSKSVDTVNNLQIKVLKSKNVMVKWLD